MQPLVQPLSPVSVHVCPVSLPGQALPVGRGTGRIRACVTGAQGCA